jgi:hypothetical protein
LSAYLDCFTGPAQNPQYNGSASALDLHCGTTVPAGELFHVIVYLQFAATIGTTQLDEVFCHFCRRSFSRAVGLSNQIGRASAELYGTG